MGLAFAFLACSSAGGQQSLQEYARGVRLGATRGSRARSKVEVSGGVGSTGRPRLAPTMPWAAAPIADVEQHRERQLLTWLGFVLGPDVLWKGFGLDSQCVVLAFPKGGGRSRLYALGRCGIDTSVSDQVLLSESAAITTSRRAPAPEIWKVSGSELGLAYAEPVIFAFAEVPGSPSDVLESVQYVVHEGFHFVYQPRRAIDVPGEFPPKQMTVRPPGLHGNPRQYLEGAYLATQDARSDGERETRLLAAAIAARREGRSEQARRNVDEFFAVREGRRRRPEAIPHEEDALELLEGIPTNLERRVVQVLRRRTSLVDDQTIATLAERPDAGSTLRSVPLFLVHGALIAALLDDAVGWDEWPEHTFPGRPGEGVSLGETLRHFRDRI